MFGLWQTVSETAISVWPDWVKGQKVHKVPIVVSWWSNPRTVLHCKTEHTSPVSRRWRAGPTPLLPLLNRGASCATMISRHTIFDDSSFVREDKAREIRYEGREVNKGYTEMMLMRHGQPIIFNRVDSVLRSLGAMPGFRVGKSAAPNTRQSRSI